MDQWCSGVPPPMSAGVFPRHADGGGDIARAQRKAGHQELRKALDQAAGGVFGRSLSDNLDLVASGSQPDSERLFDGAQILVGDSEKLVEPRFGKGHGWSRFRNGDRSFGRNASGSAGARRDGPVETERPARNANRPHASTLTRPEKEQEAGRDETGPPLEHIFWAEEVEARVTC